MLPLFGAAIFVNAALLFLVQPMIARAVLPRFGGAPAVWTTCMLFFQVLLLAGYFYSHVISRRLPLGRQLFLHALVLLLPLAALPFAPPVAGLSDGPVTLVLLTTLALVAGLPYFAVATSATLLQKWFSGTTHRDAADPYFLYAASSFGNVLGLLSYPFLLEPRLRLAQQNRFWALGYVAFVALVGACGVIAWRRRGPVAETAVAAAPPTRRQRARWLLLAFVPSSLMLGLTTYLSTDIASAPLLWLPPLALYLGSFIVAYSAVGRRVRLPFRRVATLAALSLFFFLLFRGLIPTWGLTGVHLALFFVLAVACHGELARLRPPTANLTSYYLWISAGGALGGIFNAIVAPLVFGSLLEYPVTLLVTAMLFAGRHGAASRRRSSKVQYAAAAVAVAIVFLLFKSSWVWEWAWTLALLVPFAVTFAFRHRPLALRVAGGGLAVITLIDGFAWHRPMHQERSFFGVLAVFEDTKKTSHELRHGTTIHGRQSFAPGRREEPLTYYYKDSPITDIFALVRSLSTRPQVAVLGMGTGTIAAYGMSGDHFTFFEIDPTVERVSRDPRYFTYVNDATARGVGVRVVLGDARLLLEKEPKERYDVLVADAFSSDSVPVHLITEEAARLYASRLKPDGLLVYHISNRYLGLEPVVAGLAESLGWAGARGVGYEDESTDALGSEWVVLTKNFENLTSLTAKEAWRPLRATPRIAWRDDYSNLIGAFRWLQARNDD